MEFLFYSLFSILKRYQNVFVYTLLYYRKRITICFESEKIDFLFSEAKKIDEKQPIILDK